MGQKSDPDAYICLSFILKCESGSSVSDCGWLRWVVPQLQLDAGSDAAEWRRRRTGGWGATPTPTATPTATPTPVFTLWSASRDVWSVCWSFTFCNFVSERLRVQRLQVCKPALNRFPLNQSCGFSWTRFMWTLNVFHQINFWISLGFFSFSRFKGE